MCYNRNIVAAHRRSSRSLSAARGEVMMKLTGSYLLAGASQTSANELHKLTTHTDKNVRRRVADRKRVGPDLLNRLAEDPSAEVRAAVAANPQTNLGTLLKLADDPNPDVRFSMAEDHNLPKAILKLLANDKNTLVQWRANMTLEHLWNC
mgnify:CR=1 FL=1